MKARTDTLPDGAALARAVHVRPGVGVAAHVLQGSSLKMLRVRVDQPALIVVDRGLKAIRTARGAGVRARPGQAIVLSGQQTVDFTNTVPGGGPYEARWLLFDAALLDDAHYVARAEQLPPAQRQAAPARLLPRPSAGLADAFQRARESLVPAAGLPDAVVRQRVLEVMHWLLEDGVALRGVDMGPSASVQVQVRALVAGRLDAEWTAGRVARELALSEATLRRRLAAEGTSLSELLVDARMASALTLLQATAQPVSSIALAVGYESSSRFAVRFRQRFGFAPTAVRGHERNP